MSKFTFGYSFNGGNNKGLVLRFTPKKAHEFITRIPEGLVKAHVREQFTRKGYFIFSVEAHKDSPIWQYID